MSENLEALLSAARKLSIEEQRQLAEKLLQSAQGPTNLQTQATESAACGRLRSHFGTWDSGNIKSADNEEIDRDLAREYASTHEGGT